jgi:two-component system, NtrC family, response regulator HydG
VHVDLGAIAESLFESELFGHQEGAFTDAKDDRAGRFEIAASGTLFLDEIGNLSLPMQAKLLGALETRTISRVGSDVPIGIDARILCATNMTPEDMLDHQRQFRQDLLYRINTVEIAVPALRERVEDIPELVQFYVGKFARKYGKVELSVDDATLEKLSEYHWPGNIRELVHAVERAVIMAEDAWLGVAEFLVQKRAAAGCLRRRGRAEPRRAREEGDSPGHREVRRQHEQGGARARARAYDALPKSSEAWALEISGRTSSRGSVCSAR